MATSPAAAPAPAEPTPAAAPAEPEKYPVKLCDELPDDVSVYTTGGRCGWTLLADAAKKGDLPMMRRILKDSDGIRSVNMAGNDNGFTALHLAVMARKIAAVNLLLKFGANPNIACTEYGKTPLTSVRNSSDPEAIELTKLLLAHGAKDATPEVEAQIAERNAARAKVWEQLKKEEEERLAKNRAKRAMEEPPAKKPKLT